MKFAITAIVALVTACSVTAAPSRFEIVDIAAICDRRCFPTPPKCGAGWYPRKLGACWACCKGALDGDITEDKEFQVFEY